MKYINRLILLFSLSIPCLSHAMVPDIQMPDIHQMVANGKFERVQMLLNAGTNVNFAYNGFVPLHIAVYKKSEAMVKLLLDNGAHVNAVTEKLHNSPLHLAAQNGSTDIARLLINKGANVTAVNNEGKTPLDLAVQYNKREIAELLRKQLFALIGETDNFRENPEEYRPAQQETQPNNDRSWYNNAWFRGGAAATAIGGLAVLAYQLLKRR